MKGFHLRLHSLKYKEHLHKTQSTKQSFVSFTQLIDTFTIQATWTVNLMLHFKHQHLGTFQRPWNVPEGLLEEVKEHLDHMLDVGAITPSNSAWSNTVVLVWKKDGGLRFYIDFRKLNTRTKKDAYPLPHIHDAINALEMWITLLHNGRFAIQILADANGRGL